MSRPRVALLNAAHESESTSRNFRRELAADVAEFDVTQGHLPADDAFDALAITGSRSSVYWDEPWIDATREYVRETVEAGVPALGICWGHQMLAEALGGTVEAMGDGVFEIGYREIELTEAGRSDSLFEGFSSPFLAFTTHGDAVTELPPGATVLAENDYSVQSFRAGRAVGVQFHPEYDQETAREVTRGKEFLPAERRQAVIEGIDDDAYDRASRAKRVFGNFLRSLRVDQAAD